MGGREGKRDQDGQTKAEYGMKEMAVRDIFLV